MSEKIIEFAKVRMTLGDVSELPLRKITPLTPYEEIRRHVHAEFLAMKIVLIELIEAECGRAGRRAPMMLNLLQDKWHARLSAADLSALASDEAEDCRLRALAKIDEIFEAFSVCDEREK